MREIKFRAWYQNKMHYNITKAHYEHNAMSGHGGDLWDFNDWLKWSKVMQYTGLKDKNGKEIYEGDIIKLFNGDLYTVKFIEENNETEMSGYFFSSFGSEVIGNIFENNELLKA